MAPHIALEEVGAPYALQLVSIPNGEQQAAEYLKVNPRGKVPSLRTDEGMLTENLAKIIRRIFSFSRFTRTCLPTKHIWNLRN